MNVVNKEVGRLTGDGGGYTGCCAITCASDSRTGSC